MSDFVKNASNAPKGHIAAEAAGLRWLAEPGAVPVVEVLEEEKDSLRKKELKQRIAEVSTDIVAGEAVAKAVAAMNAALITAVVVPVVASGGS